VSGPANKYDAAVAQVALSRRPKCARTAQYDWIFAVLHRGFARFSSVL